MAVDDGSSEPITVCLVADEEVVERFPGFVRYLQIGLIDEPFDFVLVAPDHPRTDDLATGSTKLIRYRSLPAVFRGFAQRLIVGDVRRALQSISRKGAMLVHSLSLSAAPLATQIALAMNADLILNVASRSALGDHRLMRYLSQAAELVTPVRAIEEAIHRSSLADKAAETVPLGVAAGQRPAAFSKPDNVPALLAAGPLEVEAGFDVLIRAVAQVRRDHPELIAFVVGKGSCEAELRRLARSLDLASCLTFTGRLEHLRSALASGDIFCVPRTVAQFREEPIHALADGLLLIIPEDTIFDGLKHGENAVFVPGGDIEALTAAISQALENRPESQRVAAAGQEHVRKNHTISGMVGRYQQIYERIARPRRTYRFGTA